MKKIYVVSNGSKNTPVSADRLNKEASLLAFIFDVGVMKIKIAAGIACGYYITF